jgi:hypothetical protein
MTPLNRGGLVDADVLRLRDVDKLPVEIEDASYGISLVEPSPYGMGCVSRIKAWFDPGGADGRGGVVTAAAVTVDELHLFTAAPDRRDRFAGPAVTVDEAWLT